MPPRMRFPRSTQSQLPPPPTGFVVQSFSSEEAKRQYERWTVENKKINTEIVFQPNPASHSDPDGNLVEILIIRGWMKLASPTRPAHVGLVREFYANARTQRTDCKVYVRHKLIDFGLDAIRAYYDLPTIAIDEYQAFKNSEIDYRRLLQELGAPGSQWRCSSADPSVVINCPASRLSKFGKAWNHFICGNLMPSSNLNEIPKDRLVLLYCICTRRPIDAAVVIKEQILHSIINSATNALAFGSLITGLCAMADVPMHSTDMYLPLKKFSHNNLHRLDQWYGSTPHPDGLGFLAMARPEITSTGANPSSSHDQISMPPATTSTTSSSNSFTLNQVGQLLTDLRLDQRRGNARILRRLEDLQSRHIHLASYVHDNIQGPSVDASTFPSFLLEPYHSPDSGDDDDPMVSDHDA